VIRVFQGSKQGFSEKFEIRTRTTMRAQRYLSWVWKLAANIRFWTFSEIPI